MEEEIINFDVDKYFDAIIQSVDHNIDETMSKLRPELYQYLKSRNVNTVSEADLEEACNKFTDKIKQYIEKNLAKFQLYSIRNIFNPPATITNNTPQENSNSSSSSSSTIQTTATTIINSTAEDSEEIELDRTLQRLRTNYLKLQKDYLQLSTECRDMDTLLKEMRSAMFNLRVALQSLEDFEISPLSETTYMVNQYQIKLQQCIQDAQDLLQQIKYYEESQESVQSQKDEESETVKMDTAESLQQLIKGFQG